MMASACVNNVTLPPDSFPPAHQSSYGLLGPSISPAPADVVVANASPSAASTMEPSRSSVDLIDFEFRLDDPVAMLPADELFSDGKLVPLHLATLRPSAGEIHSTEPDEKQWCGAEEIGSIDLVFSPKAPRCTTRWRELLGFKKQQNAKTLSDQLKAAGSTVAASPRSIEPMPGAKSPSSKSFKHLLLHHYKPSNDPSLSLPLLHDIDPEAVASSMSTRLSLSSSSSSGLDHEDLPRLSLDSDRIQNPLRVRISRHRPAVSDEHFRARVSRSPVRRSTESATPVPTRGVSVDSPRMDPSGRIIFQGLERSSSSPGSFNGRSRAKYRGMERSFSAHVRVPSVLNVPVCSLRGSSKPISVFGFRHLFSHPRKERVASSSSRAAVAVATRVAKAAGGGKKKTETERETERIRARKEPSGV
ncbi:hypothetical protein KFK09_020829 [Dendrobium nobile]|uniref:Uncharacterized protein n=1 Tax=Dendrobium nobile TaxID=94219 RepID=A0A8T3ANH5_DENNO|nr:hypothetical protein KFK09_020829 [Dendrobium nobile]